MNAGVQVAQSQRYTLGVALTDAQIAELKTDIVWLVKQTVTLAEANLKDMSDIFSLKLIRGIDTDSLIWKFRQEAVDASVGEAGFMCNSANINPFVEEFLSFYRWWE